MYPEIMVIPMREELTRVGAEELRTAEAVDAALKKGNETVLVVVNSICGCAAGRMRPAVRIALENGNRPDRVVTVFAGQDTEATPKTARILPWLRAVVAKHWTDARWETPLLHATRRHRDAAGAGNCGSVYLTAAFDRFCSKATAEKNN